MRALLKTSQGAGSGSLYLAVSFFLSGVLTYVFQGVSARSLGPEGYGGLAVLWSATFLTVQVVWIGASQTLGRHIAEREARGEGWRPVSASVKRLQVLILSAFVLGALFLSPLLLGPLFGGEALLYVAFVAAVGAYAPEYFLRGAFAGRRRFARLGALHLVEAASRAALAVALLALGAGVWGPALALVVAPLVGVLLLGSGATASGGEGRPFGAWGAFGFAGPVILCVACGQAFLNGGPLILSVLGGTREQVGVLLAALILTRVPQYILSPAVSALLPHASRAFASGGSRALDRFLATALVVVGLAGALMVGGAWLFGEWGMRLLYGPGFEAERALLVVLAALAAFYLLCEVTSQALFALGEQRRAALGWLFGLPAFALAGALPLGGDLVFGISLALALGVLTVAVAQTVFYLTRRRRAPAGAAR
ncbi:Membrane protein involved in the export of O-antigen and teichoic acid [Rubrobacter radiotolerans]|uniref:Lipopolysaccharide biosynthesis protein n=1 Tax=Rubrobacter radiotolerans TaxID=42256 RepID=A0A023WZW8_RUBRA|nr:lipopolysaccharide biosynthesis protein [Rubrobacter radiotolerans]AHY45777.1 Membrane protein involved in the export of O-antigen and teichoic acid [Rubrobacter radiotolerans]MDX5893192.1 lipopolysaccharide biosynthesis protein [Rubrobacter radiotolerans]SMC03238.1 Membrane protein involved in the export of O-antigen and teichoic acid [Rubrobacter radiotolerans DSM 5868]